MVRNSSTTFVAESRNRTHWELVPNDEVLIVNLSAVAFLSQFFPSLPFFSDPPQLMQSFAEYIHLQATPPIREKFEFKEWEFGEDGTNRKFTQASEMFVDRFTTNFTCNGEQYQVILQVMDDVAMTINFGKIGEDGVLQMKPGVEAIPSSSLRIFNIVMGIANHFMTTHHPNIKRILFTGSTTPLKDLYSKISKSQGFIRLMASIGFKPLHDKGTTHSIFIKDL